MFEVNKIKRIIKKYPDIFDRIIKDYEIETITKDKISFKNSYGSSLEITLDEENSTTNIIKAHEESKNFSKISIIEIPNKDNNPRINTKETIVEKRKNGTIVEVVNRTYEFPEYPTKKRYATLLNSTRYVLEEMSNYIDFLDEKKVKKLACFKSNFSSILFTYSFYENKQEANSIVQNDGKSLSRFYTSVKGPDQTETVYDLYNGVINERTKEILLTYKDSLDNLYDYKSKSGITERENTLVGERILDPAYEEYVKNFIKTRTFYKEAVVATSRESILKALKYKPTASEIAKSFLERTTGIPYTEFDALDFDDQQEIIKEARKNNQLLKRKANTFPMIIGSGEHSTFIRVNKDKKCLNDKVNSILNPQSPKLKEKIKSIFRGND